MGLDGSNNVSSDVCLVKVSDDELRSVEMQLCNDLQRATTCTTIIFMQTAPSPSAGLEFFLSGANLSPLLTNAKGSESSRSLTMHCPQRCIHQLKGQHDGLSEH